jgi:3'-5' exonuclease
LKKFAFLDRILLVDIETVPAAAAYSQLDTKWQQLWNEKARSFHDKPEPSQLYNEKAGIMAEFGRVICAATAYFYEDRGGRLCLKMRSFTDDDEMQLLFNFNETVNKFYTKHKNFQFAGHNVREFDIPYLCRRMMMQGVALPKFMQLQGLKPWETDMLDTLQWWKFGDHKNYSSLPLLAAALNIGLPKDYIDGSQVRKTYYEDNNLPLIVKACQADVVTVAQIILRYHNLPLLDDERIFM